MPSGDTIHTHTHTPSLYEVEFHYFPKYFLTGKVLKGAAEMGQWLRAAIVLSEILDLVLRNYMGAHNWVQLQFQGI